MGVRVFNFNPEIRNEIASLLDNEHISYEFTDGNRIRVNCSGSHFHQIVKAARAAKLTEETGLLFVSYRQLLTPGYLRTELSRLGVHGFLVLDDRRLKA
jgi:hypothetical protein